MRGSDEVLTQKISPKNSKKSEKKKRSLFKVVINDHSSIRKQVKDRLRELMENPDAYDKLESEIYAYEAKHRNKMEEYKKKTGLNAFKRNKEIVPEYRTYREIMLEKERILRETRQMLAKKRRKALEEEYAKRKEDIALREQRKQQLAEKKRQEAIATQILTERKIKWGFLVVFFSRLAKMEKEMLEQQIVRRDLEKKKRLSRIVYEKMMPIVWKRRSARWRNAWMMFKKYVSISIFIPKIDIGCFTNYTLMLSGRRRQFIL